MSQATYYDALEIKEELENEGYLKKKTKNTIRKKNVLNFNNILQKMELKSILVKKYLKRLFNI